MLFKKVTYFLITIFLSTLISLQAQTTEGTEFWLTFGKIDYVTTEYSYIHLQIRIVAKDHQTTGTIFFTNIDTYIDFEIEAMQVYTYNLSEAEKAAVYNAYQTSPSGNNLSVYITSNMPVTVYAMNRFNNLSYDVTNVLPVTALGTEYYQISYPVLINVSVLFNTYAVIATEDHTEVYQNNIQVATLNKGYLYYTCCSVREMTGYYISANKPIAHFAFSPISLPNGIPQSSGSHLFQQMAPVHAWGKEFFVPISHTVREYVRIVASQNDTKITQIGGTVRTDVTGAQTTLDNLQAGQFVELEVPLSNLGCYIKANKPVGVCTFLPGIGYETGTPAQCWIPPIEQSVKSALIAPFVITGYEVYIYYHYATLFTQTATKNNIKVSIGGDLPTNLSGGIWIDNAAAEMSFYKMPLTNDTAAYYFTSSSGRFLILGYGTHMSSGAYYYPAYSAMRKLDAAFYANDIHFQEFEENPFCESEITFRAEIAGDLHTDPGSLKWYIDGLEETTKQDSLEWKKTFGIGEYEIIMWVRLANDTIISKTGNLKIMDCNFSAEFYVNNVHYLYDTTFCDKNVNFRAEIEGEYSELKWYINGAEDITLQNTEEWNRTFETGNYPIKMEVHFENGEIVSCENQLKMNIYWMKIRNVRY